MQNLKLQSGLVYGPVGSRRLGLSLGINLSPMTRKLCPFNCVYCHYGWTRIVTLDAQDYLDELPSSADLQQALEAYEVEHRLLDHITFSGNGEATLHPHFSLTVDVVNAFRDRLAPHAKTAILSNSALVSKPEVRAALLKLDRRIMKLDAGDEATFRRINRPPPELKLEEILSGLKALGDFETQTIFLAGSQSNSAPKEVNAWLQVMLVLQPKFMQIYTLDRAPADQNLVAVSRERMRDIFLQTKQAGLPVQLY